jgi:starch phosphorylase
LAGDHWKAASDLGVPVVGVGLLYQQGYFRQSLDSQGNQLACYPYNAPSMLPVMSLRDAEGQWLKVSVEFPGRTVYFRVWEAHVGRAMLFLLDSNDPINSPADRTMTSELYGGGEELRLPQEIALGIAGWRLVEALAINAEVPVGHVTNGIHVPSWDSELADALWTEACGAER